MINPAITLTIGTNAGITFGCVSGGDGDGCCGGGCNGVGGGGDVGGQLCLKVVHTRRRWCVTFRRRTGAGPACMSGDETGAHRSRSEHLFDWLCP